MALHNKIGSWGENIAVDLLVSKGYAIVERNWRLHHYEIDIIAMLGNRIVFVEVKTRSNPDENPIAAVDRQKMKKMAVSAHYYVNIMQLPHEVQFDIIGITGRPEKYTVEHIEDAFWSPLKTYR